MKPLFTLFILTVFCCVRVPHIFAAQPALTCEWWLTAQVRDLTPTIEVPKTISISTNANFLETLIKVRDEASLENQNSQTVFYPMSGFDALTPAMLFPNAVTIIGLDLNPFIRELPSTPITATPYLGTHFEVAPRVSHEKQIYAELIRGLLTAVPHFRLLSVIEFKSTDWGGLRISDPLSAPSNGLILYDTGPGTQKRQYIHLQGYLDFFKLPLDRQWFKLVNRSGVDAVVVKGSMNSFNNFSGHSDSRGNFKYHARIFMRDTIEQWLRRSHGVLVTAMDHLYHDKETYVPEFLSGLPRNQLPVPMVVGEAPFGYGDRVSVFQY